MRRILLELVCAFIVAILIVAAAKTAGAAERHHRAHHYGHHHRHYDRINPVAEGLGHGLIHMLESVRRPARWCGWEMRQLVSSDPGPTFNLARSWASWGQSGPAGVGAVVVWPHHVGKIVGQQGGTWVVESGNDGHAVRTRPRSLAGVIAIRWGD
jgi:hypothetical protein